MPLSALPKELQDVENHFPDDDQYINVPVFGKLYRWYQKKTKSLLCFSYRCPEWWARWRMYPKVLFAICDKNSTFRYENQEGDNLDVEWRKMLINRDVEIWKTVTSPDGAPVWDVKRGYLSRVQYYSRWHFAIQWPLMVSFHFYFKEKDVPEYGPPRPDTDGKLVFFYWGHFDNELVYWMITSIFIGLGWK